MRQRVVRLRWGIGLVLAAGLFAAAAIGVGRLNAATPPVKKTTVRVVMTEYRFALTPKVVPVGIVIFRMVNKGQVPHNMVFQGPRVYAQSSLVQPGQTATLKIRVKTAGPYRFVCTLHLKLGMIGTFRATKS
jgi:plastocyanin